MTGRPPTDLELSAFRAWYEEHGLPPIPLKPAKKRPCFEGWKKAPDHHWEQAPANANIGIVTGAPSDGLTVIDIDAPDLLLALFPQGLDTLLYQTTVIKTPGDGLHVYTQTPDVKNTTLPWDAGEVRGDGGQVVAPPSVHPDGGRYTFLSPLRDVTELPSLSDLSPSFDLTPPASTQPPGRVEAPESPDQAEDPDLAPAGDDLLNRVEAWLQTQDEKLQARVGDLRAGREVQDRSGAEFALAKGMAETGFHREEIKRTLIAWGPKARERGQRYLRRTVDKAIRMAHRGEEGVTS